jgi:hypothetical protein
MCWPFGRPLRAVNPSGEKALQAFYEVAFSREMGCTEAEWLGWLPAALGAHHWQRAGAALHVVVRNADGSHGQLSIQWQTLAPRQIALMRLPRLLVHFQFDGLNDAQRYAFMRRFDLYMQRGGG